MTELITPDAGKSVCGIRAMHNFIIVADYGHITKSKGGIITPDSEEDFWRYRWETWRYGEVIAIGKGRTDKRGHWYPPPNVRIGDTVMFSRKHGTKVGLRYEHPQYGSLLIRFLDPDKTQATVVDWKPWWNVQEGQVDPSKQFYG